MTKILVLGATVIAVAPVDYGSSWQTSDQIVPKAVAAGAKLVDATLPADFALGAFEWSGTSIVPKATAPLSVVSVPERVTRRQARQALLLAGKLAAVQPAIDAIVDPVQRGLAQIEWDDSQAYDRDRPLVIAIGAAIGLDSAALDAIFIQAGAL